MPSKSKVCFFFEGRNFALKNRSDLKKFIQYIFRTEGMKLNNINYIFCSDKKLLDMNRLFLKHNFYTDILTFQLSEDSSTEAEIYISIDRVKENAKSLSVSFQKELHRVIFHGVLHLCGYEDKSTKKEKEMREREDFYLNRYFL